MKSFPEDHVVFGNKTIGNYALVTLTKLAQQDKLFLVYPVDGLSYSKEKELESFRKLVELIKTSKKFNTNEKLFLNSMLGELQNSLYLSKSEKANRIIGLLKNLGVTEIERKEWKVVINNETHNNIKVTVVKAPLLINLKGKEIE